MVVRAPTPHGRANGDPPTLEREKAARATGVFQDANVHVVADRRNGLGEFRTEERTPQRSVAFLKARPDRDLLGVELLPGNDGALHQALWACAACVSPDRSSDSTPPHAESMAARGT